MENETRQTVVLCASRNSYLFIVHSSFFIAEQQRSDYIYTGREYNRESGQYYYRARTYLSGLGRFNSKDPVGYPGYNYVRNNPMRYRDPSGESLKDYLCDWFGPALLYTYELAFTWSGEEGVAKKKHELEGNQSDSWIHCTGSCIATKYGTLLSGLLAGAVMELAGVSGEDYDPEDSAEDMVANNVGIGYAYKIDQSCEEACADWAKTLDP